MSIEVALDPAVTERTASLTDASESALTTAADACASMNVLGFLSDEISDIAAEAEAAASEMLSAVGEAAGVIGEVVSEVATVVNDIVSLAAEAVTLVTDLIAAGYQALSDLLSEALAGVENLVSTAIGGLNDALGAAADDIGAAISEATAGVQSAIAEAAAVVGDMMQAVESGGCNAIAGVLTALPAVPGGEAGATASSLQALVPQQSRMLRTPTERYPDGLVVNFNIDRDLPYADIQYRGKLTRMYYQDAQSMSARFGTLGQNSAEDIT